MQVQTTYLLTPDDLQGMLANAMLPIYDRLRDLEVAAGLRKHAYTVAEVAEQIGYKPATVLVFIRKGRPSRSNPSKFIKLHAKEPTLGDYRILPKDLDDWLSNF